MIAWPQVNCCLWSSFSILPAARLTPDPNKKSLDRSINCCFGQSERGVGVKGISITKLNNSLVKQQPKKPRNHHHSSINNCLPGRRLLPLGWIAGCAAWWPADNRNTTHQLWFKQLTKAIIILTSQACSPLSPPFPLLSLSFPPPPPPLYCTPVC